MTNDMTAKMITVMQAWLDGTLVQFKLKDAINWTTQSSPDAKIVWNFKQYDYRVRALVSDEAKANIVHLLGMGKALKFAVYSEARMVELQEFLISQGHRWISPGVQYINHSFLYVNGGPSLAYGTARDHFEDRQATQVDLLTGEVHTTTVEMTVEQISILLGKDIKVIGSN